MSRSKEIRIGLEPSMKNCATCKALLVGIAAEGTRAVSLTAPAVKLKNVFSIDCANSALLFSELVSPGIIVIVRTLPLVPLIVPPLNMSEDVGAVSRFCRVIDVGMNVLARTGSSKVKVSSPVLRSMEKFASLGGVISAMWEAARRESFSGISTRGSPTISVTRSSETAM